MIDRHEVLKDFIMNQLRCHYGTPEQIAGYLRYRQTLLPAVSHETIYAWIYSPVLKTEKLWMYLPAQDQTGPTQKLGFGRCENPSQGPHSSTTEKGSEA